MGCRPLSHTVCPSLIGASGAAHAEFAYLSVCEAWQISMVYVEFSTIPTAADRCPTSSAPLADQRRWGCETACSQMRNLASGKVTCVAQSLRAVTPSLTGVAGSTEPVKCCQTTTGLSGGSVSSDRLDKTPAEVATGCVAKKTPRQPSHLGSVHAVWSGGGCTCTCFVCVANTSCYVSRSVHRYKPLTALQETEPLWVH